MLESLVLVFPGAPGVARRGSAVVFAAVIGTVVITTSVGCRTVRALGPADTSASRALSETGVEAVLRRQTQELMDAVAPGDAGVWRRYLRDDVVYLDENGVVYDKPTLIRELTPLPPGLVGRIEVDAFKVTLHGDTAIAAGELQEHLDYHGQSLHTRFRFLDTWLRTSDGWRLAARHVGAVLEDPPAIVLSHSDLCSYAGLYELTATITTVIRCDDDGLISERGGRPSARYEPEVRDVFFESGKPRTRRIFTRDASGAVAGFVDRREGEDIRWKRIGDAPSAAVTTP